VPALPRLAVLLPLLGLAPGCVIVPAPEPAPQAPPPVGPPEPHAPPDTLTDPHPIAQPVAIDESRHLCDGRDGLQIAFAVTVPWRARGGHFLYEQHGDSYFLLDGQCHFWVSHPDGTARTGRNGTLDPALRDRLEIDLHYQRWPALAGDHCVQIADGAPLVVGDDVAQLRCGFLGLPYDGVPPEFLAAFTTITGAADGLWAAGTDNTGPVRMFLVRTELRDDPSAPPVAWPLASDPASIAIDRAAFGGNSRPDSIVVDDAADAAALRALDARYHADHPDAADPTPIEGPDGARYDLFVRDVLPFDDASGELGLPWR